MDTVYFDVWIFEEQVLDAFAVIVDCVACFLPCGEALPEACQIHYMFDFELILFSLGHTCQY